MYRDLGFEFKFIHKDRNGKIKFETEFLPNHMTNDGVEEMYNVYFRNSSIPDNGFEIGLNTQGLSQDSSFNDLVEVTGDGYTRQPVGRDSDGFPNLSLDSGDMLIETKMVIFENTGSEAWDEAIVGFLNSTDSISGETLVCYRDLTLGRILQQNDKLEVVIKIKGQQPA